MLTLLLVLALAGCASLPEGSQAAETAKFYRDCTPWGPQRDVRLCAKPYQRSE
jgi:hypothetical protein